MFGPSSPYYDKIYGDKDYSAESTRVEELIQAHLLSSGRRLLDVACGTGRHLEFLKQHFDAAGLDLSPEFLEAARARNPELQFHQGDMVDFDLGTSFDVVTCLFSAIAYTKTLQRVHLAASCFFQHLVPGGLLILEPWFEPDAWQTGYVHALFVDEPNLKIARVSTSNREGRLSWSDMHYLVGTPEGTHHFVERHEWGLFTHDELGDALKDVGFEVTFDSAGLTGRGLFVALRPT